MKTMFRKLPSRLAVAVAAALLSACAHTPPGESEPETGFVPIRTEQIFSANYFDADETLTIVRRDGEVFDYAKVPRALYDQFLAAEDKDAFYRDHFSGRFEEKKLEF